MKIKVTKFTHLFLICPLIRFQEAAGPVGNTREVQEVERMQGGTGRSLFPIF